jgi:hypothetical protein
MYQCNFEIIGVRHEKGDKSKIVRYKVKDLSGSWVSPDISEMDRMELFIRLGANMKFGVRENPSDNDLIPVVIENINGHFYIKTIANGIPEDNLGSLPEF